MIGLGAGAAQTLTLPPGGVSFRAMPVWISRRGVPPTPFGNQAVRRRAERMLEAAGQNDAELSILLCDDPTIHALNREHRGKDRPTDVLAFAMQEGPAMAHTGLLGDVVISLPTALRQKKAADADGWQEVTTLLAHGLLHLLGYDHQDDAQEQEMNAETARLCAACDPARTTP